MNNSAMCCGCGSCALVCPQKCISMTEDRAGFKVPQVEAQRCVGCNACERVCPVLNYRTGSGPDRTAYAAYAKEPETRFQGSSGGMFGVMAKTILKDGGVVYGAAFDGELKLRCTSARTEEELVPLYKSKYLQSDLGDSFSEIESYLKEGRKVLFVATPCQVHALRRFLKREYDELTTIDFLCHGVPSQSFFDRCREYEEQKNGIRILEYQFRAKKKNGATPHYYRVVYEKRGKTRSKIRLYTKSPFYLAFQKYLSLRESCYHCRFAYSNRCSDITIGDFHEIDRYVSGMNRFDGVSTVVVHTEKGAKLWASVSEETVNQKVDLPLLLSNRELMCGATPKPPRQEEFVKDLSELSMKKLVDKYLDPRREYSKSLYYALPKWARNVIKKVVG